MNARQASEVQHDDEGASSGPLAWRIGTSWYIRCDVTNSYGQPDVAELALDDEDVAAALCRQYGSPTGGRS